MFLILKIVLIIELGLLSVFCNEQFNSDSVLDFNTNCILPAYPEKGSYTILEATGATHPGAVVPDYTVIQFNCDDDYEPLPYSTAICIGGNWDTQFRKCQRKLKCPLPAIPAHGSYELLGSFCPLIESAEVPNWSVAIFSCHTPFVIVGNRTALCRNGIWSAEPPLCRRTTACVLPDFPEQGRYSILSSLGVPVPRHMVREFEVLQYDCPTTSIFQGAPIIVCRNGNWIPDIPSCIGNNPCTLPQIPVNGRINADDNGDNLLPGMQVPSLSAVQYTCDTLHDLIGNDKITCHNGIWSSEPPHCRKHTYCTLPDLPKIGSYSIVGSLAAPIPGASIAEKGSLQYNCTAKNGGPSNQVIVCSDGEWLPGVVECVDLYSDCGDVLGDTSGVYLIKPSVYTEPFEVYCDLTLTGQKWTVLQQRFSADVDFYRSYKEYSEGFGNKTGNHWLGLEHMHEITKDAKHELYVELETHDGTKAYARYDTFIIGPSSTGFQLTISGYSGTAGDSISYDNVYRSNNGMKFTTFDKNQDVWPAGNCDVELHGAWWYSNCGYSNLNGRYFNSVVTNKEAIWWYYNFGWGVALKSTRMLIRRK